jgi:hypothetical protein
MDPNPREAYTVGFTTSYDQALAEEEPPYKIGRNEEYDGGWVWKTAKDAYTWLHKTDGFVIEGTIRNPDQFSVYLLELPSNWEADVSPRPHPDDHVHRLLNDSRIVRKVEVK